ncbi:MAG: M20/M25/M40 family metallo-hydrolase [Chloroflexota bacterium]
MDINQQVLDLAVAIQQIPAPTFQEAERAAFVRKTFLAEGLNDVTQDEMGNVYARFSGNDSATPVVVTAHLDTVFPSGTDLSLLRYPDRITGPGIGDNSLGLAGLFGLVWSLRAEGHIPHDNIWLVANVGEEGVGDLCGMRAVVERFGSSPKAYVVLEGLVLGKVYHRGLGVKRYSITVFTEGGHSWVDFGKRSAIHEMAQLVTKLIGITLPAEPRTTLNVGLIGGGTSVNTIAPEAFLQLDLRSECSQALARLEEAVREEVGQAQGEGIEIRMEVIGERPMGALPEDHPLVELAAHCLEAQGIKPCFSIGSTDANVPISKGIPAICIGLTRGSGAHTVKETIHTDFLNRGLEQLVCLVKGIETLNF